MGEPTGYARILDVKGTWRPGSWLAGVVLLIVLLATGCTGPAAETTTITVETPAILIETTTAPIVGEEIVQLPEPKYDSDVSLEESLAARRSVRSYADAPLTLQEVSQLLWAAQGITDPAGLRTAPSAGGTYPLEVYAVIGNVQDLDAGRLPVRAGLDIS